MRLQQIEFRFGSRYALGQGKMRSRYEEKPIEQASLF